MNLKNAAGEPISTSPTRHPDVEPGASAMASRAANPQCRTGAVVCMAGSVAALARRRGSNARAGLEARALLGRGEASAARGAPAVSPSSAADGGRNEDDVLDLISSM